MRFDVDIAPASITAVMGAPGANVASVWTYNGLHWGIQQTITGASVGLVGGFGTAVALDQNTLVVGAPTSNLNRGAAVVLVNNGASWTTQGTLSAGVVGVAGDRFGSAVDVSGDLVIVGAPNALATKGAAYTYARTGVVWGDQQLLSLATGVVGDHYGDDQGDDRIQPEETSGYQDHRSADRHAERC